MPWKAKYQKHIWSQQDTIMDRAVRSMDVMMLAVLEKATDEFMEVGKITNFSEENFYLIIERFYKEIVKSSYTSAEMAKQLQGMKPAKKKLARIPGADSRLPKLVQFFGNKGEWPRMKKRGRRIVKNLRDYYFRKLDRKFKKIGPELVNGDKSPDEVKQELRKEWRTSKARVETIFRTETTNYFNKVQREFFENDDDIIGFLFQANRDSGTTDICRSRHGLVYRPNTELLRKNTPACHYRCRSEIIPLADIPENRKMLSDPSRDPAKRSVVPLPRGWVAGRKT